MYKSLVIHSVFSASILFSCGTSSKNSDINDNSFEQQLNPSNETVSSDSRINDLLGLSDSDDEELFCPISTLSDRSDDEYITSTTNNNVREFNTQDNLSESIPTQSSTDTTDSYNESNTNNQKDIFIVNNTDINSGNEEDEKEEVLNETGGID